jgi:tRNA (guanine37-N1)-methyltransferase
LFPERIDAFFKTGVPGKALEKNVIEVNTIQLRDFAGNKHNRIDDTIYFKSVPSTGLWNP